MHTVNGLANAHLVIDQNIAVIKLAILVFGQIGAHWNAATFSELLDLHIIGQTPIDEVERLIDVLRTFGNADHIATSKGRSTRTILRRERGYSKINIGKLLFQGANRKRSSSLYADFAGTEGGEEVRARIRFGRRRHITSSPHAMVEREGILEHRIRRNSRLCAIRVQDVAATGPDIGHEGEDIASSARAREVEAVGIRPQRPDLGGVLLNLSPRLRRGVGIKTSLLE